MAPIYRTKSTAYFQSIPFEKTITRDEPDDGIVPWTDGEKMNLDGCVEAFKKYKADVAAGLIKKAPMPPTKRLTKEEKEREAEFRRRESIWMKQMARKRELEAKLRVIRAIKAARKEAREKLAAEAEKGLKRPAEDEESKEESEEPAAKKVRTDVEQQ